MKCSYTLLLLIVFTAGPLQESAVWVNENQSYHEGYGRNRANAQSVSVAEYDDPLGISDESNEYDVITFSDRFFCLRFQTLE